MATVPRDRLRARVRADDVEAIVEEAEAILLEGEPAADDALEERPVWQVVAALYGAIVLLAALFITAAFLAAQALA